MNQTIHQRKQGKKRIMVQLWRKLDESIVAADRNLTVKIPLAPTGHYVLER